MAPKEVFSKQVETTEKEENDKLDLSLFKKRSSAKTFPGLLLGDMKKAINDGNRDVAMLIQHYYKKYKEFEKFKEKPVMEIEIVEGYKGIDNIEVFKGFESDFVIISHTKDKETGKVSTNTHSVEKSRVNRLFFWIKKWEVGETHKCYEFAEKLGFKDWKELWKERQKYFDLYYYPIKVLEALGIIRYSGRGEVTRLK